MNPAGYITSWGTNSQRRLLGVLALLALAIASLHPATAQESARTDQTTVRLVTAVTAVGDLKHLPLGIAMTLKSGWKTYWRSPGDAGFAPSVGIAGSQNVAAAELAFPVPHRFELFGLQTFGYGDEVVFPLAVTPQQSGRPISLRAHLRYLVCEQVCIPYEHDLALDLPAGQAGVGNDAALISRYQAIVPDAGAKARFSLRDVQVADDTLKITLRSDGAAFDKPDAIVEGPNGLYFNKPSVALTEGGMVAEFTIAIDRDAAAPDPAATALTVTAFDGLRALEQRIVPAVFAGSPSSPSELAVPSANTGPGLSMMLLVALVGGLILNIMPCVLPVLILKLTHVLEHAGAAQRTIRAGFLASATGIIFAFGVLALALIGIKTSGQSIGWGIQFQQPVFLGVLAALCLTFAANVWGWFQIPVPAVAGVLTSVTADNEARRPLLGAFLGGILATILATPCSAPFVGSAVGFALSQGSFEIAAIFMALGVGLALPYLVIALAPQLVTWLPRPGRWMSWLKKVLGLSLAATGLWLVFVLAQQTGLVATSRPADRILWQKFDATAIPALVAEGKTVFVDVTAEWCLTCKANKEFVLSRAPVVDALVTIHAMLADWTQPDAAISAYLASFGRFGIPMNVVYGPGAPNGILLPELLSSDDVMTALKRAK